MICMYECVAAYVLSAIFYLLIATGILLNVFIVLVNLNLWIQSHPFETIDIIITSLAMVRIILLLTYIVNFFSLLSGVPLLEHMHPEFMLVLTTFVKFCSLWWGSVLCVFYCVKITNFKNRLFMKLKMNISKMVPRLLIISLILSLVSSLPYKWFVFSTQNVNGTHGPTEVIETNLLNNLMICLVGSVIPFFIFCISIGLVIVSLLRHTRNLGSRGSGFTDAQRDVHISVIQNMFSFLLFYVLYFLGYNLMNLSTTLNKPLLNLLFVSIYIASPSLHSISLIVSKRELKNAFVNVLRCSCIRNQKPRSS